MASKQAITRLRKELKAINQDPPPHIHVSCDESNILAWSYLLEGPADTPYEGGWYWGRLKFPRDYPFSPPSILMVTPNGRFETNVRLCLSMSDYHPESWQPAWSLATVLKGLLSFMCEESPTAGAVNPTPSAEERRRLAKNAFQWNQGQADFLKAFPEADKLVAEAEARKQQEQAAANSSSAAMPGPAESIANTAGGSFAVGDVVRVQGLKSRADLNGKEGVLEEPGPDLVANGRLRVRVDSERLAVKPENVLLVRGVGGQSREEPSGEGADVPQSVPDMQASSGA